MRVRGIIGAGAVVALAGAAFGQFTNANFETGDLTGWTVTPTSNGRTLVQTVEIFDIDAAGPLPASRAGKFSVGQVTFAAGQQHGIELTQVLTLAAGAITFECDVGAIRPSGGANAAAGRFALIVDGNEIAVADLGSISTQQLYRHLAGNYVAPSAGNYTVGVRITRPYLPPSGGTEIWQYVDNFLPDVAPCYPDCDTSTGVGVLDIFDFLCFQNRYDAGATYACDCDTSTGVGVCDIFDFLCFQNAFDAGCP